MRLTQSRKSLILSVVRLHEINQRVIAREEMLLNESLSSQKMSRFLFEAEKEVDQKAAIKSLKDAVKSLQTEINELEQAGKTLSDSTQISIAVDDLRIKLQDIQLDSLTPGAFDSLVGKHFKQVTYIANGVAQVSKSIKDTVSVIIDIISETLKMDLSKIDKEKPIRDIIREKENEDMRDANDKPFQIDVAKIRQAIIKKMQKSYRGGNWFSRAFKGIAGFIKGQKPVSIVPENFADELLDCTLAQFEEYLKTPSAQGADSSNNSNVDNNIQVAADAAGSGLDQLLSQSPKPASNARNTNTASSGAGGSQGSPSGPGRPSSQGNNTGAGSAGGSDSGGGGKSRSQTIRSILDAAKSRTGKEIKITPEIEAVYDSLYNNIINELQNNIDEKLIDDVLERALEKPNNALMTFAKETPGRSRLKDMINQLNTRVKSSIKSVIRDQIDLIESSDRSRQINFQNRNLDHDLQIQRWSKLAGIRSNY